MGVGGNEHMKYQSKAILFAVSVCSGMLLGEGSRANCPDSEITANLEVANPEYAIIWFRWPECSTCSRAIDTSGLIMYSSTAREVNQEVNFSQLPWRTVGIFRSSTELMDYASQLSLTKVYFVEHSVMPNGIGMCEGEIHDIGFAIDLIPRKEGAGHLLKRVCVEDQLPRSFRICVPPQDYSGAENFVFVMPWSWQWAPNTYSESDSYVHIVYGQYQGAGLNKNESCMGVTQFEEPCQ
jgi:hypothetical protein